MATEHKGKGQHGPAEPDTNHKSQANAQTRKREPCTMARNGVKPVLKIGRRVPSPPHHANGAQRSRPEREPDCGPAPTSDCLRATGAPRKIQRRAIAPPETANAKWGAGAATREAMRLLHKPAWWLSTTASRPRAPPREGCGRFSQMRHGSAEDSPSRVASDRRSAEPANLRP